MAGSYNHITDDDGNLLDNEAFLERIENLGDAYEMAEELYDMIKRLRSAAARALERAQVGDAMEAEMILEQVVRLDGEYIP